MNKQSLLLSIYYLANTLCDSEQIKAVVFFVDIFQGHLDESHTLFDAFILDILLSDV